MEKLRGNYGDEKTLYWTIKLYQYLKLGNKLDIIEKTYEPCDSVMIHHSY